MKNTLFLFFLLICISLSAQNELKPVDGIQYINEAINKYSVVCFGESHALKEQYDFLNRLIKDKTFQNNTNDILIEFGNHFYQDLLDDYILGKEVPLEELQMVWMNTTQSPVDPWSSPVYFSFLQNVRSVNLSLKKEDKIRVIAADPPINWSEVNSKEEYRQFRLRNSYFAKLAIDEVLKKGRKALIIVGGAHLSNIYKPSPVSKSLSINMQIEKSFPNSTIYIQVITGFGRHTEKYEPYLKDVPIESIFNIKGTWAGKIPAPSMVRPASANDNQTTPPKILREQICNAMLYLGPKNSLTWISADPDSYKSDKLWEELNRRSRIRFNNELKDNSRKNGMPRPKSYN